jgi:hypothetical protein
MADAPAPRKSSFSKKGFRPSVFEEAIVKEGKLFKLSSGMIKRYQERYFTLQGHYLKYYADSNKIQKDLKGTIDLNTTIEPHLRTSGELEFELLLQDGSVAKLKSDTQEDADEWIMLIMSRKPEPGAVTKDSSAEATNMAIVPAAKKQAAPSSAPSSGVVNTEEKERPQGEAPKIFDTDKPSGIVGGVASGAGNVVKGALGAVGVAVAMPIMGAKKGGITGFIAGLGIGAIAAGGLVVAGAVTGASQITRGVFSTPEAVKVLSRSIVLTKSCNLYYL